MIGAVERVDCHARYIGDARDLNGLRRLRSTLQRASDSSLLNKIGSRNRQTAEPIIAVGGGRRCSKLRIRAAHHVHLIGAALKVDIHLNRRKGVGICSASVDNPDRLTPIRSCCRQTRCVTGARAKAARRTELTRLRRYFFASGFFDGLLSYCDPLLALPLLLALVLRQVPLDAPTLLFSLSLVSNLSTLGLSPVNCALDSAANLVSIIRRIQNILLLPEHSPAREQPLNTSFSH